MSVESINQTANPSKQLPIKTPVQPNHLSVEHSVGSSIFSPPTAPTPNGKSIQLEPTNLTVAQAVVKMLEDLGVRRAFGVSGGAIAPFWATLTHSSIEVLHFRHEAGAAFAATEAYIANGEPVVVFTTTGPGITNALTGLMAARWEGAKVIFLSASTSAPQRGRWGCQETSAYTMPISGIFTSGPLFNYATTLENDVELPEVACRLANGLARPEGFVAHISIPTGIQTSLSNVSMPRVNSTHTLATLNEEAIAECVHLLSEGSFAIWVGFGARNAAKEIRDLAEKTGAAVMSSPRGKGIFPENHPQFVGVTGVGGDDSVLAYMQEQPPLRTLVLGTRLSEPTSFWSPVMIPSQGFIHVDIDPEVPRVAYPTADTFAIQSDIRLFLKALLKQLPEGMARFSTLSLPRPQREVIKPSAGGLVRPEVLLDAIQRLIVEGSDAVVMAESGNSLAWGNHMLRFAQPGRYRVSTGFGSMGHFVTGVVGAALARNGKAVAIVGDGAMLMNSEVSTAVKYQIPAVWIVLNDGGYNMCKQGMSLLGFKGIDGDVPQADFVEIAHGMGANGIRVETESDLEAALEKAMASPVPFVVDVIIDANQPAPIGGRVKSLISQGAK
ncbi:ScyA-related TPP-binding enzyme [Cylindrospermum sp. FACHB-282]|uniref:ScyA-related TPP-binding enzyme n=1 Tax=Cylindrospermum sp. FACHB-282 TaxID=2692794 RepID=UPI0016870E9C|nr:ScyA-related TPP-binding enzyme [Cylindrospermum sp. FACHB-282]MBD2385489.1 thiamine pyrophosphate-binding protein [Cylindrospermum sp. FACHB-282]